MPSQLSSLSQNHTEKDTRKSLAAAYHALAYLNMDDHIHTHLSARGEGGHYFAPQFGLMYEEMTASNFLKMAFHEKDARINHAALVIHSAIYENRPDINYIFHIHTPATTAVSVDKRGLLPVTQWALFFYGLVAYHPYDAIILSEKEQGEALLKSIGNKNILIMHNHGVTVCGKTVEEAFFYTYFLEKACRAQCAFAGISDENILFPSPEICAQTQRDMLTTEQPFGHQTWQAMLRKLDRLGSNYAD